jgi:glutathione synthase/RimK-type ligase-like ATP-grasp enzyme
MILIISNESDVTTDFVIAQLGESFIRFNSEHFANRGALSFEFSQRGSIGVIDFEGRTVSLDEVSAVYYRRPGALRLSEALTDPGVLRYAHAEYSALLDALNRVLDVRWVNHPLSVARAESKPLQLKLAQKVLMRLPRTIVTNSPDRAREFVRTVGAPIIAKTIRQPRVAIAEREHILYTSDVPQEDISTLDSIALAPCILQERIEKVADVRVTVVGDQVFAVMIESQGDPSTRTDWRVGDALRLKHKQVDLPKLVATQCLALTKALQLEFAAIDFALDELGNYWFFEVNPQGQWAWLDLCSGTTIAAAIAKHLVRKV